MSTLFDSWKKAIGEVYSPQQTGSFKTTWGVPVEGDPDVEAAKDYPDLRGFPNPDRSIDPFTGPDPWYSFSMAFDWRPFPDQMRHAVLVGKHDALRVNLCGLDPFEFIHQQQVRFFYKSEKNYKIVVAAYPLMTPAKPGVAESMGTKKAFTVSPIWGEYKVMDCVFEMGDAVFATYQDACFRTAIALVRRYLMICTLPPPPACPNAGCKKFARYKSVASDLHTVNVACEDHAKVLLGLWTGHARPTYTITRWAAFQVRRKHGLSPNPIPDTTQLTLKGLL